MTTGVYRFTHNISLYIINCAAGIYQAARLFWRVVEGPVNTQAPQGTLEVPVGPLHYIPSPAVPLGVAVLRRMWRGA
jgi:hypothetical protein